MHLLDVAQLGKSVLVAERNEGDAMVSQSAHGVHGGRFLTTAQAAGREEDTGLLAPVATPGPDAARLVPEGLPLGREVAVPGGDAKQDGVIFEECLGCSDGVVALGRGLQLLQNLVRECLGDPGACQSANLTLPQPMEVV